LEKSIAFFSGFFEDVFGVFFEASEFLFDLLFVVAKTTDRSDHSDQDREKDHIGDGHVYSPARKQPRGALLRKLNGQASLPCFVYGQLEDQRSSSGALNGGVVGNIAVGLLGVDKLLGTSELRVGKAEVKKKEVAMTGKANGEKGRMVGGFVICVQRLFGENNAAVGGGCVNGLDVSGKRGGAGLLRVGRRRSCVGMCALFRCFVQRGGRGKDE
jgi:hypothetical protein